MNKLKIFLGLACLLILASSIVTMSRWKEARGVYDDVCYLRQAHLFQRFGMSGLDTDISRDDDHYLKDKLKEIDFADWNKPGRAPCHTPMPGTGKFVLQYPPGTGFMLALFPQGHQIIPLYACAAVIVCFFALLGIASGRTLSTTLGAGLFGCLAVYLMVNPAKASYSIAPTLVVCAAAGFLTALWLVRAPPNRSSLLPAAIGLLLGLAVNFRLPNLFLASGYLLFFLYWFAASRRLQPVLQGIAFGAAFVVGMVPTLLANAINAGSPFATTYGSDDVVLPHINLDILRQYATDLQFLLILLAAGSTIWLLRARGEGGAHLVALIAAGNLLVNLAFFLSHPLFTPYYTVPVTMLSLWSLCFAPLIPPKDTGERELLEQAARS
ncbi:MAG: hypothetical protein HY852_07270 [Bradyrhizobium sp.]|uniref:hypothetical protein n=1 Tax=Bradyrhizobium sp. TaxID=376 RepID=UPI0025C2A43A|nr:hypothetical protein [Bradyrhizobium sp.]MBI5261602.1 hypothetical protein [Bradyrhizobium sp.]